jgi:hypothetical protein
MFYCIICNQINNFNDNEYKHINIWARANLKCKSCYSIVRERGMFLQLIINTDFKTKIIHELSPNRNRYYHKKLIKECPNYSFSYYFDNIDNGKYNKDNIICANIENLPFTDNSFDIFINMDVFEHIWNPILAFKEIYRVLKDNGLCIMTFPIDSGFNNTEKPVLKDDLNTIIPTKAGKFKNYTNKLEYHGNPINDNKALVTHYWGYDVIDLIKKNTNFIVEIKYLHDVKEFGITGVMNECFVLKKNNIINQSMLSIEKINYYDKITNI